MIPEPLSGASINDRGTALSASDTRERYREKIARITLDSMVQFVGLLDANGTVLEINKGALDAVGITLVEVAGKPFWDTFWWQVSDEVNATLREQIARAAQGEFVRWDTPIHGRAGGKETILIDASLVPVKDERGQVVFIAAEGRDITEKKAYEQEIARQREELAELDKLKSQFFANISHEFRTALTLMMGPLEDALAHSSDMSAENRERLELAHRNALRQLELVNTLLEAIHPADRARVSELVEKALDSGSRYEADHRVTRPDGSLRWVRARGQVEPDSAGKAARFPGVVDVTDRMVAEATLARVTADSDKLRRLYETILSATPDFIYVFSLDHRVLYANDSLIRMWGRGREGAIGKTFLEIGYEPWHAEMHVREIDQVRATKQPIRGEVPFTGTHGRRIYDYIFVPVIGADGEVEAVAGTTRDVTDRKEAELALAESDRKKDEFIALLAHELRNPLAPIRSGLEVMRRAEDPAVRERAQLMMDRQLAHMVRLIDDLLDVSRIGRSKMELRRARVSLAEVMESAIEASQPAIDAAEHALVVSLPPRPVHLDADLTRLAQVVSNLLTNAAKYTERGGTIWLSAERRNAAIEITVKDTGIGIPAASLPTIFDMFSQVDRGLERSAGGLGIGLALVKGLTEMHGGTVTAKSDGEGRGSTFVLTLPTLPEDAALPDEVIPARRPARVPRRVLVVDDNRDAAESLGLMLKLHGHQVVLAHDGEEAIQRAEQSRPDVILMDVGMPRLNGLDATRRIRQEHWGKTAIIIALTGWGQDCDREQSRSAGCNGHLVKPVALEELDQMLGTS